MNYLINLFHEQGSMFQLYKYFNQRIKEFLSNEAPLRERIEQTTLI